MCSRKRKYLKKLQVFICLVTLSSSVRCDEVGGGESYAPRDHKRMMSGWVENGNATAFALHDALTPREREEDPYKSRELARAPGAGSSTTKSRCPPSCFCEKEAGYAACVGDGQWAPPVLPEGLIRVELRGFYLPKLGPAQLKVLPAIRELQINHCNLSLLLDDTFAALQELDGLDLSENRVSSIGPHSLRGLKVLRHLDLSVNHLTVLDKPFTDLASLQHLNLHHNSLRSLNQDTFQGLSRVQYIDLDSNEISFLEVSAFQHLTSLAHLILSNNQLSSLATLDFFGSRLQYIDLSNIGISRVPQALTQFVRDLRLARNVITEIHRGDLDSYPYLTLLVLDNNNVEILEEDALGRHEYLSRLWLNGNRLVNIPLSLPPSLQALYLDENSVTGIHDGDFRGLIDLQQLSLQHNNISIIAECAFCELLKLKTLNLQGNLIANLTGKIFSHLTNLEDLDISQNPLLSLDGDSLWGLMSLRSLQLSHIQTEPREIPDSLFDSLKGLWILEMCESPKLASTFVNSTKMLHTLRGLRELNIMHNGLTALKSNFPSFFPQLQTIKLSGNTWDCSSPEKINWMKHWMEHSSVNFYRSYSVRCATPLSVSFKPVILLEDSDFENVSDSSNTSSTTVVMTTFFPVFNITTNSESLDADSIVIQNATSNDEYLAYSTGPFAKDNSSEIDFSDTKEEYNGDNENKGNLSETFTNTPELSVHTTISTGLLTTLKTTLKKIVFSPTVKSLKNQIHEEKQRDMGSGYSDEEDNDDGEIDYDDKIKVSTQTDTTEAQPTPTQHTLKFLSIVKEEKGLPYISTTRFPSVNRGNSPPKQFRPDQYGDLLFESFAKAKSAEKRAESNARKSFRDTFIRMISVNFTGRLNKNESENAMHLTSSKHFIKIEGQVPTSTPMLESGYRLNKTREVHSHHKDLWLYRGDNMHGVSIPVGYNHARMSNEAVVGAGIVATIMGVALFVCGFLLAQGRAKSAYSWDSSSLSSTYWRDGSGENEVLMAVDDDSGSTDSSSLSQAENGDTVSETQAGLNSRLYLLLQRDSRTGITPDSLPDPRTY